MTTDREKLREDVARAIYESRGFAYEGRTIGSNGPFAEWAQCLKDADAAIALIWPAAMREAAGVVERWSLPTIQTPSMWLVDKAGIVAEILSLLSPDAEKEG